MVGQVVGVGVEVGVGVGPDCAQYLPPVLKVLTSSSLRPRRSFHCRSRLPCDCHRAAGALVVLVAVQLFVLGLYLPPVLESRAIISTPDDHFTAGPDCRVGGIGQKARWWCWWLSNCRCWDCISRRCCKMCEADAAATPHDHFTAGPDCRVNESARGRVGRCWWLSNYSCWDCISRRCSKSSPI